MQVPLFASVSDAFLRHLTLKIRPSMFLPGEFIVHKGDVGLGMFFLYHGKVSAQTCRLALLSMTLYIVYHRAG